jgi:hypothetical protein
LDIRYLSPERITTGGTTIVRLNLQCKMEVSTKKEREGWQLEKSCGGELNVTVAGVRCWKLPAAGDLHVGGCDVMAVSLVTGGAGSRSYRSD